MHFTVEGWHCVLRVRCEPLRANTCRGDEDSPRGLGKRASVCHYRVSLATLSASQLRQAPQYACGLERWKAKAYYQHTLRITLAWLVQSLTHDFCPSLCLCLDLPSQKTYHQRHPSSHSPPYTYTATPPPCFHPPQPSSSPGASPPTPAARPARR